MTNTGPILIAYDGSDQAYHAINHAATIAPGAKAVVLYVRQPLESVAAHLEGYPAPEDVRSVDAATRDSAERLAADGADYARSNGLDAEAKVASSLGSVADTIADVADQLEATLIVIGSRGSRSRIGFEARDRALRDAGNEKVAA